MSHDVHRPARYCCYAARPSAAPDPVCCSASARARDRLSCLTSPVETSWKASDSATVMALGSTGLQLHQTGPKLLRQAASISSGA